MLYNNLRTGDDLPENLANVGFIVRDYEITIGDDIVTPTSTSSAPTMEGGHRWDLSWDCRTRERIHNPRRKRTAGNRRVCGSPSRQERLFWGQRLAYWPFPQMTTKAHK